VPGIRRSRVSSSLLESSHTKQWVKKNVSDMQVAYATASPDSGRPRARRAPNAAAHLGIFIWLVAGAPRISSSEKAIVYARFSPSCSRRGLTSANASSGSPNERARLRAA
jgi:hypothetical protein